MRTRTALALGIGLVACLPPVGSYLPPLGSGLFPRRLPQLLAEDGTAVLTAVIEPREIDDLLANPGMGWQTFHRFADQDPNLAGLPSTSAYFRFYWSEIEPEEGKIDFPKLDGLLARARKAGQQLAFRVMCAGTSDEEMYVPGWLKEKGCPGFEYRYQGRGRTHWVPDMDHALFRDAHFRLIEELGKRYDGHPDVDLLDIGTVGLWGEWHMSGTGVEVPSLETRREIIAAWCEAFPRTPRVMLIGDAEGMKEAARLGCGWRADCLGDMGGFSKTWNHMENLYRQQVERTGTGESWKKAPVAFESCWDMRKWTAEGWDVRAIFDYALDLHASLINNKSAPIPEGTRAEVERCLRKLGYRLVLRRLEHPRKWEAGKELVVKMVWENVGVASPYRDHRIAFRLRPVEPAEGTPIPFATATSVRGWLPGRREATESLARPERLAAGAYELDIAVTQPPVARDIREQKPGAPPAPALRLAIAGRRDDGWYALGRVEVER